MNKGAYFYLVYWDNTLVAMFSVLNQPSGMYKYAFRVHRMVVLPDFQGLGIGTKLVDFFGKLFVDNGDKLFLRTTHLRLGNHCRASDAWTESSSSQKQSALSTTHLKKYKNYDRKRTPYSFEYVGADYNNKEHQYIICLGDCPLDRAVFRIQSILDKSKCPIVVTGVADQKQINVWEEAARKLHIRTEILFVKQNGQYNIVKQRVSNDFDAVLCDMASVELLKPYEEHMKSKYITV